LLNPRTILPMGNIKILRLDGVYAEEFVAAWPYCEIFFGGQVNSWAKLPAILHSQLPEIWACGGTSVLLPGVRAGSPRWAYEAAFWFLLASASR
jgi:hypothetical protein